MAKGKIYIKNDSGEVQEFIHEHTTAEITSLNGYTIASATGSINATDSLNVALGKIQKTLNSKSVLSNMSSAEASTGTATTARAISAKVLNDKIAEMIPDVSVTSTGTGNAVTSIAQNEHGISVTLGTKFSTDGHTHSYVPTTRTVNGLALSSNITLTAANVGALATNGTAVAATTATKLGSATVGSGTKPIYLNAGTATAFTATVGSTDTPVYLNGGSITTTGKKFSDYLPLAGGTMSGTITGKTITATSISIGSINIPATDTSNHAKFLKGDGSWDTPTNTTYAAGTKAQLDTGTDTTNKVWQPKVIADYVKGKLGENDALVYKGTISAADGQTNGLPNSHTIGWTYKVAAAGTYAGQVCEIGDMIICSTSGTAKNNAHWDVIQRNIDGAVTGPASAVNTNIAVFSGTTGKLIADSGKKVSDFATSGHTHSTYLPLAGGTMSGVITRNGTLAQSGVDNGSISMYNGTSAAGGGGIWCYGANSSNAGKVRLQAYNGNGYQQLDVNSDGTLTWKGVQLPTKYVQVGQSGNTTANPWFKVASVINTDTANMDADITFYVTDTYNSTRQGILNVHLRTDSNKYVAASASYAKWLSNSGYELENFVIAYTPSTAGSVFELWTSVPLAYTGRRFTVISESSNRTTAHNDGWELNAQYGTGSASVTTGLTTKNSEDASSIPWGNVTEKPSTFSPSSHNVAVTTTTTVTGGNAVTSIAQNEHGITVTLGKKFSEDGHTHSAYSPTNHNHSGTYLPISGTAADSAKLGGVVAASYSQTNHTHSYVPTSRTVNSKALSTNITLTAADVGASATNHNHSGVYSPTNHTHVSANITDKMVKTAVGPAGWDVTADRGKVVDVSYMSYWNGAYSTNNASNLTYCKQGAFGTIVTKNAGDYATTGHTHSYLPLSGGVITGTTTLKPTTGLTASIVLNNNATTNTANSIYARSIRLTSQTNGNVGLYDITNTKWIVAANSEGNVTLYGNAQTATTATKLGSGTVGSGTKPIYLNAGTATAFTATVGSNSQPVWLNAGTITACTTTFSTNGHTHSYLPLAGGTMSGTITGKTITATSLGIGSINIPATDTANKAKFLRGDGTWQTVITAHQSLSGYVPTSRTVNSKALSANITLTAADVGASATNHTHSQYLTAHQSLANYLPLTGGTITGSVRYKNANRTRGTGVSGTAAVNTVDYDGIDNAGNRLWGLYNTFSTAKQNQIQLIVYPGVNSTGSWSGMGIGYDGSGNVFTNAPNPAASDSSSKIATTKFVKDQGYLKTQTQLSISTSTHGGNAVTAVSVSNHAITLTKGSTFSLSNHTHSNYLATNGTAVNATKWASSTKTVSATTASGGANGDIHFQYI